MLSAGNPLLRPLMHPPLHPLPKGRKHMLSGDNHKL